MEILIYAAILALITSSVITLLLFVVRTNTKVQAVRATVENAKNAVNTMTNEIREARSVYDPTSSTSQLSLETAKSGKQYPDQQPPVRRTRLQYHRRPKPLHPYNFGGPPWHPVQI